MNYIMSTINSLDPNKCQYYIDCMNLMLNNLYNQWHISNTNFILKGRIRSDITCIMKCWGSFIGREVYHCLINIKIHHRLRMVNILLWVNLPIRYKYCLLIGIQKCMINIGRQNNSFMLYMCYILKGIKHSLGHMLHILESIK